VKRKGRNALGSIISISGLTADARDEYSSRSTFITIDGLDLMAILEGYVRLDDASIRKKRHVNETGGCYFSVSQFLSFAVLSPALGIGWIFDTDCRLRGSYLISRWRKVAYGHDVVLH
jgi:hypothetical protein